MSKAIKKKFPTACTIARCCTEIQSLWLYIFREIDFLRIRQCQNGKQAGAELCQAQFKLGLAETALAIEKY
jgi:hypothetical protein